MSMLDIRSLDNFLNDYKDYSYKTRFVSMFDVKELKELLKEYAGYDLKTFNYNGKLIVDKEIYDALKRARYEADMSYLKSWHYFENEKRERLQRLERQKKISDKPKLIPA